VAEVMEREKKIWEIFGFGEIGKWEELVECCMPLQ